jgi:hypothetical protein
MPLKTNSLWDAMGFSPRDYKGGEFPFPLFLVASKFILSS